MQKHDWQPSELARMIIVPLKQPDDPKKQEFVNKALESERFIIVTKNSVDNENWQYKSYKYRLTEEDVVYIAEMLKQHVFHGGIDD